MARSLKDILITTDQDYESTIINIMGVINCDAKTAENIWDRLNSIMTDAMRKSGYDPQYFPLFELEQLGIKVAGDKKSGSFWLQIGGERKSDYLIPMRINNDYQIMSSTGNILN